MRVLFLDIDGVLNHRAVFVPGDVAPICPVALARLKALIERTGATIVVSSTWRRGDLETDRFIRKLRSVGILALAHSDWRTRFDLPIVQSDGGLILKSPCRGDEIAEWLSRHLEVDSYAIVDDDSDMLPEQRSRFVQTTFEAGLLDWHCEALEIVLTEL